MRKKNFGMLLRFSIFLFVLSLITGGCATCRDREADAGALTQVSTIDALLAGSYDGQVSFKSLLREGDFGIGTFHGLDGEMILLDGRVYQVRADGNVYVPGMDLKTPFAAVVRFHGGDRIPVTAGADLHGLEEAVNKAVPSMNSICAVKVKGRFARVKTRSVPAQAKPYPPLTEVTKNQPVFELENVSGTLVGFRLPPYVKGVNMPGFHFHFLSDDAKSGGHVLECRMDDAAADGYIQVNTCNRFVVILPEGDSDFNRADLGVDRSGELEKAER